MRWPVDLVNISQNYNGLHPAYDLAAPTGTPIKAPEGGMIAQVNNDPKAYFGGLYVVLMGDSGHRHYMGHNSRNRVSVGQGVVEGQHIADVGATGFAVPSAGILAPTGPHNHFETSKGGKTVDFKTLNPKEGSAEMAEKVDLYKARILAYSVLGWNGLDGTPNALSGDADDELKKNHVGKELDSSYIDSLYKSAAADVWRNKRLAAMASKVAQADKLAKRVVELESQKTEDGRLLDELAKRINKSLNSGV